MVRVVTLVIPAGETAIFSHNYLIHKDCGTFSDMCYIEVKNHYRS